LKSLAKSQKEPIFLDFLIIKPLFKLFGFAPIFPFLTVLQWILSIFSGFALVKPSGQRSGWLLALRSSPADREMMAFVSCIGPFQGRSLGLRLHVLTIGPGWPSAGRRAGRGVNGPHAIRKPQAASGGACCRRVAYTTLPGSRECANREKCAWHGGRDTGREMGVEIPAACARFMGVEIPAQGQISIRLF
jgi:hypothetical protein